MFLALENIGLDVFIYVGLPYFTELKQKMDFSGMAANLHKLA